MVTYPSDWATYTFDEMFQLYPNNTLSRDKLSEHGTIGNIHYGDVLIKYGPVLSAKDSIPKIKAEHEPLARAYLQQNDIIVADTAEDETVGKVVQIESIPFPLVGGLHTIVCRPLVPTATGYLGYYMNSKEYHDQLLPYITGIKVSSVSKTSIRKTELHIPLSVEEQETIVNAIGRFDSHIANLIELIKKKKAIRDGALEDLVSGRIRIDGFRTFPTRTVPIGTIRKVERGTRLVRSQLSKFGGYPVYQNSLEPLGYYHKTNCGANSVYIIAAGSAAEIGFSNMAFWAADDCYYFGRSPEIDQKFLYYALLRKQKYLQVQSRRTSIPRLSRDVMDGLEIYLPHIKEQEAIADALTAMDDEIKALEDERNKMIQIREGAMDDLLTGRVRLLI